MSAVSAAEHLFRSTQWAHAWHDGFHWAQITHNWVRSWLVCSSKKQCKTARKNKSEGCEMAKGCCSLFNEASQHSRWFSRCYLPILQMHTSGLCKTPLPKGEVEGAEVRYWGASTPASKLIAKQENLILFNQNSTQRETATQNMYIEEKDLLAGVPWVKASCREKEHLCLIHFLHWTEWFYAEHLTAKSIPLSALQS